MKTRLRKNGERWVGPAKTGSRWLWLGAVVTALMTSSCALNVARPGAADLRTKDGHNKAVVLIRVVTEIDGQGLPAFRATYPQDSIWLGLGDFSSGGKLEIAPQQFFSKETRLNGWTYLLLEPGIFYLAPHPPQNENAFAYDRSWKETPPRWRFEVPRNVPVVYVGTLFVPGRGRWLIFGGRMMQAFDEKRFEIRDESALAESIHQTWLKELGPITTQLVQRHSPSDPIILETPPGR
jgi:hypothetical protein